MMKGSNLKRFAIILAIILLLLFVVLQLLVILPVGIDESRITTLSGLIGLMTAMASLFPTVIDGLDRVLKQKDEERKGDEGEEERPLFSPISPDQLRKAAGAEEGTFITWVDRGATSTSRLRRYRQIVITGKPGSGKSREALELIRRMVAEDHVSSAQVLVPEMRFWRSAPEDLDEALMQVLDHRVPALFLIDGILSINPPEAYRRLEALLDFVRPYQKVFVIITAQSSEYSLSERWFADHGVREIALPDLDPKQTRQLVSSGAKLWNLAFERGAREALWEKGDGTPRLIRLALQSLSEGGERRSKISRQDVLAALSEEWQVVRGAIQNSVENSIFILGALDAFHLANLKPETERVLKYAHSLWADTMWIRTDSTVWVERNRREGSSRPAPDFQSILSKLERFGINTSEGTIEMHPLLAETPPDPEKALQRLKSFIEEEEVAQVSQPAFMDQAQLLFETVAGIVGFFGVPVLIAATGGFAILGALFAYRNYLTPEGYAYAFWGVVIAFSVIGALRGWAKELLTSTGLILSLFLLSLLNDLESSSRFLENLGGAQSFFFHAFILVFLSVFLYRSVMSIQRLSRKTFRERVPDTLLGQTLGAVNGYLFIGSILYYLATTGAIPALASIPAPLAAYLPPLLLGVPAIYFAAVIAILFMLVVFV